MWVRCWISHQPPRCMFLSQLWGLPHHCVDWQRTDKQPHPPSESSVSSETTSSSSSSLPQNQIWILPRSLRCLLICTLLAGKLSLSAACTSTDSHNLCHSGSSAFLQSHRDDRRCIRATEWSAPTEKHLKDKKKKGFTNKCLLNRFNYIMSSGLLIYCKTGEIKSSQKYFHLRFNERKKDFVHYWF